MALKFLNKKGWHTGSLRNIENVWKLEQKHEAEELGKHIHEERERDNHLAKGKPRVRQLHHQRSLPSGSAVPGALFEDKPHSAK
ncbi:hypothetical protein SAY87_002759 [Trapa incisa]|uniref:CBF1-interacting co-repressor CIR N-terminal domain-containing protein n=1 Tax=Trapa incisa TaxID=236973 RepID=A0AAN7Q0P7_9MYRT|nr:hypothetical protein SAY87_002759 [Trapa incisa]